MRFLTLCVVTAALIFIALALIPNSPGANSYFKSPGLSAVASTFAQREVSVRCYFEAEPDSPGFYGSWGYVRLPVGKQTWMALDDRLCDGADAVNDQNLPIWQRALGVLVGVHEAYHLRRWGAAGSEAKVECKAIRHWKVGARLLGASEAAIDELWPFALASHYRLTEYVDGRGERPYYDKDCVVPKLWDPPA